MPLTFGTVLSSQLSILKKIVFRSSSMAMIKWLRTPPCVSRVHQLKTSSIFPRYVSSSHYLSTLAFLTSLLKDPEAFNAQYFDLPDGIICRAWQATASEVSINMKIDFALTRAGPRIDPPPYSVQVMETGQFVPEQMGLVKISPKFLRYALTPRGDPTKQLGEISFLYPKIWLYSQRPPHPTHDV